MNISVEFWLHISVEFWLYISAEFWLYISAEFWLYKYISVEFWSACISWLSFDYISWLIYYWLEANMLFIDKNLTVTLHIFSLSSFHKQLSGKHIHFTWTALKNYYTGVNSFKNWTAFSNSYYFLNIFKRLTAFNNSYSFKISFVEHLQFHEQIEWTLITSWTALLNTYNFMNSLNEHLQFHELCWTLTILWTALLNTYNFVYSFVEHIVLTQYKKNDEGHVDVMRVLVLCMVENLQKRHHLQKIQTFQGRIWEFLIW